MTDKESTSAAGDHVQVEYITPNFAVHRFNAVISERKILYQVIKMTDSLLIFINDKDNMQLSDMFVAMMNRFGDLPVGSRLMGDFMEEASKGVALRLSKKLNKTVFVSCNVEGDRTLLPLIEKRMYEEIKENRNMFD